MAPWKKAFHVPGNLIKHRIARLLGQFTGGCLDRIIRGGLFPTKDRWIDLRGWAYSLLHPTKSQPFDTRISNHRPPISSATRHRFSSRSTLAYERIIIASGDFSRRELLELKGELETFLLHGYSCLKWMLFLCRFAKN